MEQFHCQKKHTHISPKFMDVGIRASTSTKPFLRGEHFVSSVVFTSQGSVSPCVSQGGIPTQGRQMWGVEVGEIYRDPAVRLGSFGFKKVKKNLKAVRVVSVPVRFGSSRFKKRFGSMSAIRVLPESNSNLAISFQSILCWNYF